MAKKTTSINQDTTQTPSFEASMQELEQIVNRLESGELPLEEALNEFEHGVRLARVGQKHYKMLNNVFASYSKRMMTLHLMILSKRLNN